MYIAESLWPDFKQQLLTSLKDVKVGSPLDDESFLSAVIDKKVLSVLTFHDCRNWHIVITGRICPKGSSAVISFTHGPILGFFALQGRHIAPIKVKFGREEQVHSSVPNLTLIGSGLGVYGPQN